jgi:hypothetical protein
MVTTIQISEDLKNILSKYKKSSKETYEDVIKNLIKEKEKSKKEEINLLKENYRELYGVSKKIAKDYEVVDREGLEKIEY